MGKKILYTTFGPHLGLIIGGYFFGLKRPKRDSDHSSPFSSGTCNACVTSRRGGTVNKVALQDAVDAVDAADASLLLLRARQLHGFRWLPVNSLFVASPY